MTLLELCEPAFQCICRLNRIARNGGNIEYIKLKADIKEHLDDIAYKAEGNPALKVKYDKVKLPLIFFVDSMIVESGVNCAMQWHDNRLSYDHNELAGDEAFFDYLDQVIENADSEDPEILAFYYTCLGLGFTGFYTGQTELLRQKMSILQTRIRNLGDFDLTSKFCQHTYDSVNTDNLVERPTSKILGIAILFGGLTVLVFAAVIVAFKSSTGSLNQSIERILEQEHKASFIAE